MSKESFSLQEVLNSLQESIESSISFLIPSDFEFLKRGGRLTPLAATLGGMLKIVPVMTLSEDRKRIEKYAVKRTLKKALDDIIDKFKSVGVNHEYLITILQVDALEKATEIVNQFKQIFTNTRIDFMELSPAFIAQAGPGCIVIQAVKL